MMKKIISLALLLFVLCFEQVNAQALNGAYSIDPASPISATNFQTFNQAATALNTNGVAGPVTINVAAGNTFIEQVEFTQTTGVTATNSITINGNGSTLTNGTTTTIDRYTLLLNHTSYITIENLNIIGTNSTNAYALQLMDSAHHNQIKDCDISVTANATNLHQTTIVFGTTLTTAGVPSNYNVIENCSIRNGYYGIYMRGNSSANRGIQNKILNCVIEDYRTSSVFSVLQDSIVLAYNDISRPTRTFHGNHFGIYLFDNRNALVNGNHIHNWYAASPTITLAGYGIFMNNNLATSATRNVISNNLIEDVKSAGDQTGIRGQSSTNFADIFHNTIVFDDSNPSSSTTYGIEFEVNSAGSSGIAMQNNNISLSRAGTGHRYGLYLGTAGFVADHNNIFFNVSTGLNFYARQNNTNYANLAAWVTNPNGPFGQNSSELDPQFAAPPANDYEPTNAGVIGAGATLGVLTDIKNASRPATAPTVGAFESLCVPMAGTYTVDQSLAASQLNFTTLDSAVSRLQDCGISAAVIFDVAPGQTFVEQIQIPEIVGASATNTITINGNNSLITFSSSTIYSNNYTIALNGADYVTINNLQISNLSTAGYCRAVVLFNGADHNVLDGCLATSSTLNLAASNCMVINISPNVPGITGSIPCDSNTIQNCEVVNGDIGIYIDGSPQSGNTPPLAQYNRVLDNEIRDFRRAGTWVLQAENTQYIGNEIHRTNLTSAFNSTGIGVSAHSPSTLVSKNYIHSMSAAVPTAAVSIAGIQISNNLGASAAIEVSNNLIENFKSLGPHLGILSSAPDTKIYHNTVVLDDAAPAGTLAQTNAVLLYPTALTNEVVNNNLVVSRNSASTFNSCLRYWSNNHTSENNNLYIDPNVGPCGMIVSTDYNTLCDWQTATGLDMNSFEVDPDFVNPPGIDYEPQQNLLQNGAAVSILDDFLNNTRSATSPTIGAIEGSCVKLSGTYTINPAAPASASNFNSLTSAINGLSCGVTGPVILNVAAGSTFNGQFSIPEILGASATNTITINGNNSTITNSSTTTDLRHTLRLSGASYFYINDFTIETTVLTNAIALNLTQGARHNILDNCTISAPSNSVANSCIAVLYSISNSFLSGATYCASVDSNKIENSTISGGNYAISLTGNPSVNHNRNQFDNCLVQDFHQRGAYIYQADRTEIVGCEFTNISRAQNTTRYGILSASSESLLISKNHFHNPFLTSTPSLWFGMYITSGSSPVANKTKVLNNLVEDIHSIGTQWGIGIHNTNHVDIHHNTIVFDDVQASISVTTGIICSGSGVFGTGVDVRNNNVSNTRNGTGNKYAIQWSSNFAGSSNNNNFYVNGPQGNNFIAQGFATLALWQASNGGIYDQNSTAVDPGFVDPSIDDYHPQSPLMDDIGAPLGVVDDFLSDPRSSTTPDAGAFEFTACTPLAGTYTIDNSIPASATNYQTFSDVRDDLCICGISAPVVFDVANGQTFNEQVDFCEVLGASAINTITFNGNASTLTYASTVITSPHTLRLTGSDYFRFNNLNIESMGSQYTATVHLYDAADNNEFHDCTFTVPANNSSSVSFNFIIATVDIQAGYSSTFAPCNNNLIKNCTVLNGFRGICILGNSSTPATGNVVDSCTIQDFRFHGLWTILTDQTQLSANDISRPNRTITSDFYGIFLGSGVDNALVAKNHIHNPFVSNIATTYQFFGLMTQVTNPSVGNENLFVNNLIEDINSNGNQYGFYVITSSQLNIYHNTVDLSTTQNGTGLTAAFRGVNSSGINIRNNNFNITRANGGKYGFYLFGTSVTSNYNNTYVNGALGTNFHARIGTTNYNFAAWQSLPQGVNSTAVNPAFVDPTINDYHPQNPAMDNIGAPLGVVDDFLSDPRSSTTPDAGAFEFTPCTPLAGTFTIDPTLPASATNYQTFNDAKDDLCDCGISAPVIFNVASGQNFNEQVSFCEVMGASATNTITFNGNNSTLTHTTNAATDYYTLQLFGSDYFTFKNLNVFAGGTNAIAVHMVDSANHNLLDSCTISCSIVNTGNQILAVVINSDTSGVFNSQAQKKVCAHDTIMNCQVVGGFRGIVIAGSTSAQGRNHHVANNTIQDFSSIGIAVSFNDNVHIINNDISRPTRANTSSSISAISAYPTEACIIEKNHVHEMFSPALSTTSFTVRGIVQGSLSGSSTISRIENNLVENFRGRGSHSGIQLLGSFNARVWHNTIALDSFALGGTTCTGITALGTGTSSDFRNNNIYLGRTGFSNRGFYLNNNTTAVCDYNNVYVTNATNNYYGQINVPVTNLALWQTVYGGNWDANSKSVNPLFVNPAVDNYQPSNGVINDLGFPLGVTDDYVNAIRSTTTPDFGAYEFTCSPLAGTYTVDQSLPVSATNFQTFNEVACALCNCGISAPVIFNVAAGQTFNEQVDFCEVSGASAINTITFNANGSVIAYTTTSSGFADQHVVRLSGSDYFRFNNLVINQVGATGFGTGIHLYDGANHNIFDSCTINQDLSNNVGGNAPLTLSTSALGGSAIGSFPSCDSNKISNSVLNGGYYSISCYGATSDVIEKFEISNCQLLDARFAQITGIYTNNLEILENDISNPNRTGISNPSGIRIDGIRTNTRIEKNYIHDLAQAITFTTFTLTGISVFGTAAVGQETEVVNNVIGNFNSGAHQIGISIGGANVLLQHNTIDLSGIIAQSASGSTTGISVGNVTGIDVRNNIVSLTRGGHGFRYGLHYLSNTVNSDYNNIYVNGIPALNPFNLNITAFTGVNSYITLADWQAYLGGSFDQNSTSVDPTYANPVLNDYTPTNLVMDNIGTPLGVLDDFLNSTRSLTTPDAGAFEFGCIGGSTIVSNFVSPTDTIVSCHGSSDAEVTLQASLGAAPYSYILEPGTILNSTGYYDNLDTGSYTIIVYDAQGCTDTVNFNVTQPDSLLVTSISTTNPNCLPGSNGSLSIVAQGGTAPYQYNIGGANQSLNTFNALSAGTYLVTVIDANGCTDTMTAILVTPPNPVISSAVETNVTCNGANDGSVQVNATGTATLSYTLMPGALTNATGYYAGLAPNTYTITVSDGNNCTASTTITITEPPVLVIDSTTTVVASCSPGNDGSITVHASGGTTNYQYNIGGANQASNVFNSLASGNYIVTVTDANNCTASTTVNLLTPNGPTIASAVDTNVSCNGANDGSVQVNATGTGSLSYTLMPGALTNATGYYAGLAPSTYTITVSDGNNCTASTTITITEPAVLFIDSTTNVVASCSPGNDGSITVHASGGTTNYQYNIGGANQASNVFNSLASGNYIVTVTDANNCTASTTVDLLTPNGPTIASAVDTNVSCNGANDGSVQVNATGTGSLSYTLMPGALTNATGYYAGLAANTYTITVSDGNNCTASTTITITEPPVLVIDSATTVVASCSPGNDGSITVHASGGTTNYQYNIGGANQASNVFNSLASGNYIVTVTDANNCTTSTTVNLLTPNGPTIASAVDTNVSCNGAIDGSVQVNATGTGTLSYTLMPGALTNVTGYYSGLAPNTYTITVSDGNNCTASTTITITEPAVLFIDSTTNVVASCSPGNDGSITVHASGGTTNYQYNIGGANQASNVFNSLASGNYIVTVTDANNCTTSTTVNLLTPNGPTIASAVDTNVSCNGANDGSVQVNATGTGTLSYTLIPGALTNATGYYAGLAPSTYTITVSDGNNCTASTTINITQPPVLVIDSATTVVASCSPGNDGSITVHASGGTTNYQYNIGGANQASNVFNSLASGNYIVTVTDANNCTTSTTVNLLTPNGPTIASAVDTNVSCNGANDGSVQVNATGTGSLSYTLIPGALTNATGYYSGLAPNTYTITVSDGINCTASTTITITEPAVLFIDSTTNVVASCSPGNDGSITVHASGGTTNYQYNIGGANQASNVFNSLASGNYIVTVTDANNCTTSTTVNLVTPNGPTIASAVDTNVSCNGANDGSVQVNATGTGTLSYTLMPGALTNATGYYAGLAANTYTITVSDGNNCTASTTINITQPPSLLIDSTTNVLASCSPGNDGSITVHASGGTTNYQYNIGGANQASNVFNSLASGNYIVTVTDANNCTASTTVNLLTPNGPTIASAVDTNVSCNGANDGSVQVNATGTGSLSYTLMPGALTNATGYYAGLAPSTYTITVSDGNNCTASTTINITQPPSLLIDSTTNVLASCSPGNDGSITVHASGGTTNYQYNIGGANQASNVFNSLASGNYIVTVTDANNCTTSTTVNLVTPNGPTIASAVDTNVSCNGANDGSVQVNATGTGSLSYTLMPGALTNATGYYAGLAANTYTITVSDGNNCTASTTITITEPAVLIIDSLSSAQPSCSPGNDGSIVVNISGGTAGYQYNVGGANQSSNTFTNLASGIYLVTVTDTNLCTDTLSINLSAPNAPVITSTVDTNVSCFGANDGSLLVAGTASSVITYTLMPGAVTNSTGYFNNLGPNTYTITLSDASNCTVSTTVTITEPAELLIDSLTSTLPSCSPGNDGSIVVNISGGTAGYQYNVGGANQSSNTFTNLASGIYLVTVTDTNLCTDTLSINLSAPNAPVITSTVDTSISCFGANDGSILVAGTASSAITYTLNPGAVTNSTGHFNNLGPNTYTITLSDASNCTVSTTVTITEPAELLIDSLTSTLPSCSPGNDGSIVVNISGGTAGYQYNVGGANQSSNTFTNLASGIYLVTVTDTNLCTDTLSINLSAPNAPVITSTVDTSISCFGANDGSILVAGTASSAITYTLNPGAVTNSSGYFNNLAPNTYTITLSDASNCTVSTTVSITEPAQLNIDSLSSVLPSCSPGNDGSIVVNISGGTAGYQYNIGGANQSSNTFTNLASGIYLVTVTDTNLCTDTLSINLSAPNAPVITSTVDTSISCFGANDGSILIAGTGASAITYTLNPGAVTNSTGYFATLGPNTYTITLSDASNCTVSTTVTITEPSQLNIDSLSFVLPSCSPGNDGSIVVNISGGTAGYQYNVGGANQSSNTFNNLASGIYLVTVTDTNLCTDTLSINLSAPNAPVITSTVDTSISCFGANDGSILIAGTATSAITYTLNPGAVTNSTGYFNNLGPNTYTITLSDASNCTVSTTVAITEPSQLNIDSLSSVLPSCSPGNDGSIVVNISGGTAGYQYNIGGANQSSNTFNNLASGIYLVTVTDTNLCTDTMSINLSAPNAPVITSTVDTSISCFGANDGSILITGTGASAITYTLMPGAISNSTGYFNNLGPNTYTITLSDVSNCTVSTTVSITEPAQLNIDSLSSVLPSCSPGNDGSIVVNISGGTAGYQYNIGGANQSSNTFNNLASGIYLVTVTDTNLCTDTLSINLSAPNAPVITSTIDTSISCYGANDGSILIAGTASSAITYTLMPGAVTNSTGYFNNLGPNTYTITLSDASNCTVSTTVAITEPSQLNIDSLSSVLPSCSPGNDGSIVINISGGTAAYQYNIGGANQSSNTFNNLASGIYLVTVTDTNLCTDTLSINLSAPNAPVITSIVDTSVSCFGANDGSILIAGTGASAITYTLMPGAISNSTGYFNNLGPNTYTITLSDASNCTVSTTVTITEPSQLNIDSLSFVLPSCSPGNDGSIVVNISGGTAGYQYNIGGANQSLNTFNNLASGIYLVTVTDTNLCTDTLSINLSAPNAPVITSTVDTSISCFGANDGSILIAGTATSAITYTLNPGAVTNSTGYFNNLGPNTYTITLSDASNCTVSTTVSITEPAQLNIDSLSSVLPSCSPGNDGSIVVNISGGTAGYQYNIGGANQSSNTFNNLASGIYLVTVTDTNLCTDTMSINLSAPNAPVITSTVDTSISCFGANDGSILVAGTASSAITYTLMPGAVSNSTGYFNNLGPNTYTITLSDASNCTVSTTVTISEPAELLIDSLTSTLPSCSPGNDGSIVVNVSGGTAGYQYNVGGANQSSNTFNNLASGIYLVTVTDTNLCTDTMSINLSAPNAPVITSTVDTSISCFGANDGSILIAGTGAFAITYTLMPGAVTNSTGYFNNLGPNTYTITLSDANNCTASTTVTVTEPAELLIDSLTTTVPTCNPGNDGSIIVNISGGTAGYQYNIGGANQNTNVFNNLGAGSYLVTVIDTNGCTDSQSINLIIPNGPMVTSSLDTNLSCNGAGDGSVAVTASGNGLLTYTLMPGAISNATGYFNNLAANNYTITVSDGNNCTVSTSILITEPAQLLIDSVTLISASCSPGNDGSITIHVSGGTAGYQYDIGAGNQASNVFNNLASASYTITVTDANNCTQSTSVVLQSPNAPIISAVIDTLISCNGAADGSIAIVASGNGSLTYSITPIAQSNSMGYFNNLGPNNYTITVTDGNGCTATSSVSISEPAILSIDSTTDVVASCSPGGDGSISVIASGGTAPYSYTMGALTQSNNQFNNLSSASYIITVTDANNCTTSTTVNLITPNGPTISSLVDTNVSCHGLADGSLLVSATGISLSYTIMPGAVTNGNGYFNNLGPNNYTITISDANNCSVTTSIAITEPDSIVVDSLLFNSPTCSPGGDGEIIIYASGGTSPFSYDIGGGSQTSNVFTGLNAATYYYSITDDNGCSISDSVVLTTPNTPIISAIIDTNVSCNAANDGSVQIVASSSSTLTYTVNPGALNSTTPYFNGLSANTYTVVVTDASNCTTSTTFTISEPSLLAIDSISAASPSCIPGNDGSLTIYANGGTPTYQYSIGALNQTSNQFGGLAASTYLVSVTDANGCIDTQSVTLTSPIGPVITNVIDTNVSCSGNADASIQIVAVGSALNYTLMPNNVSNSTGYFNGLNIGNYTITVTDASNCTASTTLNITQPNSLIFTADTIQDVSCFGFSDGQINIGASGGTPNYSFTLLPNNVTNSTGVFQNLLAANYTVIVTDANNCSTSTILQVSEPSQLVLNAPSLNLVSCFGGNDGSISITASGGTSAYTYQLLPNNISNNTGIFNTLTAGNYTIVVVDANSCSTSTTLSITEPNAFNVSSLVIDSVSCYGGSDGEVSIAATGGTGILTYSINSVPIQSNTNGNFNGLSAGPYVITISDANSCTTTTAVQIDEPNQIVYTNVQVVDVSCNGGSDGEISVTSTGGTGLITYSISPVATQISPGNFVNLSAGIYTISAVDINSCQRDSVIVVNEPQPLASSFSSTDVLCNGGNDGGIIITASGGLPPYTYTINTTPTQSNNTGIFSGLFVGNYTINIIDSNGCAIQVGPIAITEPPAISFNNVATQDVGCFGDSTGSISVSAIGGTGLLSFSLSPSLGTQTSPGLFENLPSALYIITATDANGCTSTTNVNVNQNPEIIFTSIVGTEPVCSYDNNGSISASASGGIGSISYYFNDGTTTVGPSSTAFYPNIGAGIYIITAVDALGCSKDTIYELNGPDSIRLSSLEVFELNCLDSKDGKVFATATGGRGSTYTYQLLPGLQLNTSGRFVGLAAGTYTLTITDSARCSWDTTIIILPSSNPMISTINKDDLDCIGSGNEGAAEVIVSGGTPPYIYLWSTTPAETNARVTGLYFGYYTVDIADANGCVHRDTVYIEPGPCCTEIFIPSAFSPNGDGNNDNFGVHTNAGIQLIQFEVRNRWGEKVFKTNDYNQTWDGKYKGEASLPGTYFYLFKYKCLTDGVIYTKGGDLTLIR